jgi:hypothetical protein
MNILPLVITDIVFQYCDPWKETQKRKQKRINQTFDLISMMTYYHSLKITDVFIEKGYKLFGMMCEINPSVEEMINYITEYKKDKYRIKGYLERKDEEEIEERNLSLYMYDN